MSESELRSDDDIEAILKIAVSQTAGIEAQTLRERLMASAAELGITPEQVAVAEDQWARQEKDRRDLAEFMALRKRAFWSKLASFLALDIAAVAVNLITDHSVEWAVWVFVWTGFWLAMHALGTFFPGNTRFQRRYRRWRRRRDPAIAWDDHDTG